MQLAPPNQVIDSVYDVLVVGSGYGAAVAALRSAEHGKRVALLERGREMHHGDFPTTPGELLRDLRVHDADPAGRADGLFELMPFRDLTVLKGSGLGGGSLINAGVAEQPKPSLSENPDWPTALRQDADGLQRGYEQSAEMLQINPYPDGEPGFPPLLKTTAFRELARKRGAEFSMPHLSIHFGAPGYNRAGKYQETCVSCGNCFTGCNYSAKNSLDKNYLAHARQLGAEIFTGLEVSHLRRVSEHEAGWLVYFRPTHARREDDPLRVVRAREVYLGAGAPGSTEILLRSRELGDLSLSDRLGHSFSANSGSFGAVYDSQQSFGMLGLPRHTRGDRRALSEASGTGEHRAAERRDAANGDDRYAPAVGPTITGLLRDGGHPGDQFVIEDCAIPAALVPFAGSWWPLVAGMGSLFGSAQQQDRFNPFAARSSHGMFLAIGHDNAGGRIALGQPGAIGGRANLVWPGLASQPNYRTIALRLRELLRAGGGIFNSARALAMLNPITVHPLGGCGMGDDSTSGVCDHAGHVFDPQTAGLHAGLYVCDASLFPASLGTNPFWTIAALAERALAIHNQHALTRTAPQPHKLPPGILEKAQAPGAQISLSEQMAGCWSRHAPGTRSNRLPTHAEAHRRGESRGLSGRCELNLELVIADLNRFLDDPEHRVRVYGTADIPGLNATGPLSITEGTFALFAPGAGSTADRVMRYRFKAVAGETGDEYSFEAVKYLKAGALVPAALKSLTTAELTIYTEQTGEQTTELGRGLVRIDLGRFFTYTAWRMEINPGRQGSQSLRERNRLVAFFTAELARLYGPPRLLRNARDLKPPPAKIARYSEAGIRSDAAVESIPFLSDDGLGLLLRRVRTKSSGTTAVLLIHGLTSSADMFIMPEHENLCNVLLDQGYEVWLLDFRMSNRFGYNTMRHRYSFDDVAMFDMRAAIRVIRQHIGTQATLHAVAHCLGSISISMAVFAGLLRDADSRLDSLVSNSVSLAVELPTASALRLQALVSTGLLENGLRTDTVDPEALHKKDWLTATLARGLALFHQECDNSACHMLSFMWGAGRSAVFEHENLSPITHDRLGDLFGPTGFHYHQHVIKLHADAGAPRFHSDAHGPDFAGLPQDYLSGLEDNQTPLLLVSGDCNKVFGRSQERMLAHCQTSSRPELYRYALIEGYGHQDVFMGRRSAEDVFGLFLDYWRTLPAPGGQPSEKQARSSAVQAQPEATGDL